MVKSKEIPSQDYFEKSQKIWFPDFTEMLEAEEGHYSKYAADFSSLIAVLRFFRKELSRAQFVTCFLELKTPQKMLHKPRDLYTRAHELCTAYQNQSICDTEFDEQLLLSFRNRPTEDVFTPAFELWDEINLLMSRLEEKSRRLPIHFDGTAWNSYLKGIVTRKQYAGCYLAFGTGDHLAQVLAYGVDKENFAKEYSQEISVCLHLRKLCIDYKAALLSPDSFDSRFLELAKEFCVDISE